MTDVPVQFKAPWQPQVNLMPPEVGERREKTRRRGVAIFIFVVFLLLLVAGFVFLKMLAGQAQAEADRENQRTAELQAQLATYTEVDTINAQLTNSEAARQYAAAIELFWPLMYSSVNGALPEGTQVQTMSFDVTAFGTTPAPAADPFAQTGVAQVTLSAFVPDYATIATLEDSLNSVPYFTRARATAMTRPEALDSPEGGASAEGDQGDAEAVPAGAYLVQMTVTVTYDGLMLRYTPRWFGTDEQGAGLEQYYQDYYEALINGSGVPSTFPPQPEVTPPPFVPGTGGVAPAPAPDPSASPAPSAEVAP
jgi:Tfp pilus assembly protein PilN